jgi:hypothetical protein
VRAGNGNLTDAGSARRDVEDPVRAGCPIARNDRSHQGVRPGGDANARSHRVPASRSEPVERNVRTVAATASRWRPAQPCATTSLPHLKVVLGVEWERVPHDDAAAGSDRHPLELRVLRQIASHPIHDAIETDGRIAHGKTADLRGRRDVALDECRGDTKDVGDIVEAGRRIVGGSSALTSTSSARRSRMALLYSARFRRWSAGAPGSNRRAADASSAASRAVVNVCRAAGAGFGAPSGGMDPVRSLRTTFSHTSA